MVLVGRVSHRKLIKSRLDVSWTRDNQDLWRHTTLLGNNNELSEFWENKTRNHSAD